MKLKLITFSMENQTIGKLYHEGVEVCRTMERPWLHNKVNISCIPGGVYDVAPVISNKFGKTYQITNVLGRTHILLHKANWSSELQGCIAPVSEFGVIGLSNKNNALAGLHSGKAYNKLMELLRNSKDLTHTLEIERH